MYESVAQLPKDIQIINLVIRKKIDVAVEALEIFNNTTRGVPPGEPIGKDNSDLSSETSIGQHTIR